MRGRFSLGVALALACAGGVALSAQAQPGAGRGSPGRVLFLTYCASCHGSDGRGSGPAAEALVDRPTDLTRLTDKYGAPLPRGALAEKIDGRSEIAAHGAREMPVWGRRFQDEADPSAPSHQKEATTRRTIDVLIDYLESIQSRRSAGGSPAPVD